MSWLRLKRLLPPRKAWKLFTNKLQLKLNKSKALQKIPKSKPYKKYRWPNLSIQPKNFKLIKSKSHTRIHKKAPTVYVNRLFIPVAKKRLDPPSAALLGEDDEEKSCPRNPCDHQKVFQLESVDGDAGVGGDGSSISAADEMWESLVMNSAQMRGINERAEEFIARFRAQMHQQEMMARRM